MRRPHVQRDRSKRKGAKGAYDSKHSSRFSRYVDFLLSRDLYWSAAAATAPTRRHWKLYKSLLATLALAQEMKGHAKGRELRERVAAKLARAPAEFRSVIARAIRYHQENQR